MKYYGLHNSFIGFNGSKKDIIEKIHSITIDKEKFVAYFREELDNFKNLDDNSDVKMYEYFINNYTTKHLFHDVFHPTNLFFYEMFRQIVFKLTGHELMVEDMEFINLFNDIEMTNWALPILPVIKEFLKIKTPEVMPVFVTGVNGDKQLYMNVYDYYYIRLSHANFETYLKENNN